MRMTIMSKRRKRKREKVEKKEVKFGKLLRRKRIVILLSANIVPKL